MSKTLQLSNNRWVHFYEQGNGEPLVLVHGVGMRAEAWQPQIEHFSRTHRVFAIDMPGHGKSDKLPAGSELQDFVFWAAEVIEQLSPTPVNLVGHSMGSLIAMGVSVTRPDLVSRVALLNGVFKRSEKARKEVRARAASLRNGVIDVNTPLERWFTSNPDMGPISEQVKGWLEKVDIDGYAVAYSAFANGDAVYAEKWPQVSCPVLALTGSQDKNSTAEMTKTIAALVQDGEAVVLDGERHMPNLTVPALVNASLENWLQKR